jgi:hypothetical protein
MAGDLSKASAKVKSEIPGKTKEAQKDAEKWASQAGSKVDSAVSVPNFNLLSIDICHFLAFSAGQDCFPRAIRALTNSTPH